MQAPLLPKVIGHRGAPRLAPENTLSSFRAAAGTGIKAVEFDVALTLDARPVVFHDASLERTTDGQGLLAETPLEVLNGLDAGLWFSDDFAGETVPTLEETLELLGSLGLTCDMELKPDPGRETETARLALATAVDCWQGNRPPLVTSFSRVALAAAKEAAANWPRGLNFDLLPQDWRETAAELNLSAMCPNAERLTQEQVAAMKEAGLTVMAWTVNAWGDAERLLGWGVDSLCTDAPQDLRPAVARYGLVS